jgi:hypothetical protein
LRLGSQRNMPSRRNSKRKGRRARYETEFHSHIYSCRKILSS